MIDRILFQISRRYWDCNPNSSSLYCSIDVVYGILFSIVLLNTDLNTVNIGARTKQKMPQKIFIKNTMSFILSMNEKSANDSTSLLSNSEYLKKWKRDMEKELGDIYHSVKEDPIIQNMARKEIEPAKRDGLVRSNSSWSVSNSVFSTIIGRNRKNKSGDHFGTDSVNSDSKSVHESPPSRTNSFQILIEGILIRKHVTESDGEKARSRKWVKYWCAVRLHKENNLELVMNKLSHASGEYEEKELSSPKQFGDIKTYPTLFLAENTELTEDGSPIHYHLSVGDRFNSFDANNLKHPVLSPISHDYKIVNQDPEYLPLIHSYTDVHYHSPQRPFCFSLCLSDSSLYFFQAPTEVSQRSWISTINYWAARKSREPMRGGMGNVDYGWSIPLIEIKNTTNTQPPSLGSSLDKNRMDKHRLPKYVPVPLSTRLISTKDEVSLQ
jgi:hypothetical protein